MNTNILQKIKNWFRKTPTLNERVQELISHVTDEAHREIYFTVIKNQLIVHDNHFNRQATCPKCGHTFDNDKLAELLPKLAVKVLDEIIILNDIISIQPMEGPVGLIHKLRYAESENNNRLSLQILREPIEAGSRKLATRWAVEALEDAKDEEEILNALASEISCEIISEIFNELAVNDEYLPHAEKVNLLDERLLAQFVCMINQRASKVAITSRRGAGNILIVSPPVLALIQSCKEANFVKTTEPAPKGFHRLRYAGIMSDYFKVYCDMFPERDVIVTYKGASPTDAGYFYSPYTILLSTGVVMDPNTFEPIVTFMTRYGRHVDDRTSDYSRAFDVDTSIDVAA